MTSLHSAQGSTVRLLAKLTGPCLKMLNWFLTLIWAQVFYPFASGAQWQLFVLVRAKRIIFMAGVKHRTPRNEATCTAWSQLAPLLPFSLSSPLLNRSARAFSLKWLTKLAARSWLLGAFINVIFWWSRSLEQQPYGDPVSPSLGSQLGASLPRFESFSVIG